MSVKWEALTTQQGPVPDLTSTFTIQAPPKTDIWRPTLARNVFNAPAIITRLKASQFRSITVTVSSSWVNRYDQGGLLLVFPGKSGVAPVDAKSWIKGGIELDGHTQLGTVGCYAFSDYCLCPLPDHSGSATIKFVRDKQALWIYVVHDGKDTPLREITWSFLEDRDGDAEVWAGVYAARPTPTEGDPTVGNKVEFKDLKLETI